MKKIKVMSTFSGVGGLELGLDKRFEVVGMSEIYPSACDILRHHHPDIKNHGDITKLNPKDLPEFDMLVGGSPCQSLSTAGRRQGLKGYSKLFYDFTNILKVKKPEYFLWENVGGTFNSTQGYDFLAVIDQFQSLGYNIQWQLVNSSDLGSAQARNRVFVIGSKKLENLPGLLDIEGITKFKNGGLRFSTFCGSLLGKNSIVPTITKSYGALSGNGAKVVTKKNPSKELLKEIVKKKENKMIRLLTPLECERLMTWPDNHTKYGVNSLGEKYELTQKKRYEACGNGIVSVCVKEILKDFSKNKKHVVRETEDVVKLSSLDMENLEKKLKTLGLREKDYKVIKRELLLLNKKAVTTVLNNRDKLEDLIEKISNPKKGVLLKSGKFASISNRKIKSKQGSHLLKDVLEKSVKTFLSDKDCKYLLSKMK